MVSRLLHVPAHNHAPVPEDGDLWMKPRFAPPVCALTPVPKLAFTSGWGPSDRPRPGRASQVPETGVSLWRGIQAR
jgi:hypothetical protein